MILQSWNPGEPVKAYMRPRYGFLYFIVVDTMLCGNQTIYSTFNLASYLQNHCSYNIPSWAVMLQDKTKANDILPDPFNHLTTRY